MSNSLKVAYVKQKITAAPQSEVEASAYISDVILKIEWVKLNLTILYRHKKTIALIDETIFSFSCTACDENKKNSILLTHTFG